VRSPEVVVFGSLTIDNVLRANGEVLPQSAGGNAVYAALGARLWSDRSDSVGIVSRYGAGYPEAFIDRLAGFGIDVGGIRKVEGPHRMNVAFAYQEDGSRTRMIPSHLLETMTEADRRRFYDSSTKTDGYEVLTQFAPSGDDMPPGWWSGVRCIHCPSIPMEKMADIAAVARRSAAPPDLWIGVDSPWHDSGRTPPPDGAHLFADIDVLAPSEQDLTNYRPGVPQETVVLDLLKQGVEALALKRGPNGCRLYRRDVGFLRDVPAVPVDAPDPTGAGDSFCGGLMAGFRITGDFVKAALYGVVAASFCVEQSGVEGLIAVDRREAENRLAALSRETGVVIKVDA
jgi:sugar/nucleoside kinase (ribokinase family)